MDIENQSISVSISKDSQTESNLPDIDKNMYAVSEAFMVLRSAASKRHYGEEVDIKGSAKGLLNETTELLNALDEECLDTEDNRAENNSGNKGL